MASGARRKGAPEALNRLVAPLWVRLPAGGPPAVPAAVRLSARTVRGSATGRGGCRLVSWVAWGFAAMRESATPRRRVARALRFQLATMMRITHVSRSESVARFRLEGRLTEST